jgi:predicted nuclease of predicted toxin-antitoxin system
VLEHAARSALAPAASARVRILLDQATPAPLRRHLTGHQVETVYERDWSNLKNGELLDAAEREDFAVLVTTETNPKFQKRLAGRRIAIVVLTTTSWPRILRALAANVQVVDGITGPAYVQVVIP